MENALNTVEVSYQHPNCPPVQTLFDNITGLKLNGKPILIGDDSALERRFIEKQFAAITGDGFAASLQVIDHNGNGRTNHISITRGKLIFLIEQLSRLAAEFDAQ